MSLKMKVTTQTKDLGAEEFFKAVKNMKSGPYVKVGILEEAGNHESGMSVASIAAVHEFGSTDGNIPERSFIRATMDENKGYFTEVTKRMLVEIMFGGEIRKALGFIGQTIASEIKKRITKGIPPPNKPSTIRAKGSSKPLIDTGRLRSSIAHEVVLDGDE